ncbi:antibiotic biosynthesis monooxygenase family protein [Microbaculum marinum]|uniref:Antibiotic biosynthesis monooxygenase n=1 Tax=Microbaculum marinum TaxID=1764581 RepID=A0AAW9RSK5_9HYPH
MIVRRWRGWALPERRNAYRDHFERNVLPELKAIDGFHGAELLEREDNGRVEYVVETRWASFDAIRAFAGDTPDLAVVEPEAVAALEDFDRTVHHYSIVATS